MKDFLTKYRGLILSQPICILFLLSAAAQEDKPIPDSTRKILLKEYIDSVAEKISDDDQEKNKKDETTPVYFLEKSPLTDPPETRHVPDSIIRQLQKGNSFWYANYKFKKPELDRIPFLQRKWVQVLLWLLIIGSFAAFIMWYLADSRIGLFRRSDQSISATDQDESQADDIFAINYQKEIDKAIQTGNYRFGIRLMFLRLLRNLSDKKIIQYKQEKTNMDYLIQLHTTSYYKDFFWLARNYEYSWYGQFDVSREAFNLIKNNFESFENKLSQS